MVSVTSALRYITSASSYHLCYQSRSSMYIRGLIPRNFAELAEAVPIGQYHGAELLANLSYSAVNIPAQDIRIHLSHVLQAIALAPKCSISFEHTPHGTFGDGPGLYLVFGCAPGDICKKQVIHRDLPQVSDKV